MIRRIILLFFCFFTIFDFALAQQNEQMVIVGKSFVGKKVNGVTIREFIGNVVITQKDVRITCDRAIQNLNENKAELIGNVIVKQDTITIKTPRGFYFGNEKKAYSYSGIFLDDGHVNLTADSGYYFSLKESASFFGNVKLIDSSRTLFSDSLFYFSKKDSSLATGKVVLKDSVSTIFSDSLIYLTKNKFTDARCKVKIKNKKEAITIFAERLLNYPDSNYTLLLGRPLLMKIDTVKNAKGDSVVSKDTLFLSANKMESYSDSTSLLIARDSVLIVRGDFASVNKVTFFYRKENKILTFKRKEEEQPPVIWQGNSQLTGDSIAISIKNNSLKRIDVFGNAVIISKNKGYNYRFDQLSGDTLKMFFDKSELKKTFVTGNVLSIYYLYDKGKANGLIKSSGDAAKIFFQKNKVVKVKFYGKPESDYHPEKLIEGEEQNFTVPAFYLYKNKPSRRKVIGRKKIFN
jgi:lipopolysaccharide export system protein LptA